MQGVYALSLGKGGNIFVSHRHCVLILREDGTFTRLAGRKAEGKVAIGGDGSPALYAQLKDLACVSEGEGKIYILDSGDHRVRVLEGWFDVAK